MSADEQTDLRDKPEGEEEDVVAHRYVANEAAEDDPERKRKRKRKQSEESEGDDLGRKRK